MATFSDVHVIERHWGTAFYRSLEVGLSGPLVDMRRTIDRSVSISADCYDPIDLPLFIQMIEDQLRWLKEQTDAERS